MSRVGWDPMNFDRQWAAFCDADHADYCENFIEVCEEAGYAELVPVDNDALEDPFAAERGIYKGGSMWSLTESGHRLFRLAGRHREQLNRPRKAAAKGGEA